MGICISVFHFTWGRLQIRQGEWGKLPPVLRRENFTTKGSDSSPQVGVRGLSCSESESQSQGPSPSSSARLSPQTSSSIHCTVRV